jgi:hypothetical protein
MARPTQSMTGQSPGASSRQALVNSMRKLWSDHVIWTRLYIIHATQGHNGITSAAEKLPVGKMGSAVASTARSTLEAIPLSDKDAAAGRLLRNQDDIGDAVASYYGADAGKKVTALLKQHIMIAVELVAAAVKGDTKRFEKEDKAWTQNADEIAAFLAAANPNWPLTDLKDLLHLHLELTKREATARIKKDWKADVEAFDDIYNEILNLADALSAGIMKQFPQKFPNAAA